MQHKTKRKFTRCLLQAYKPYTRALAIAALGLSVAMTTACGSDDKGSQTTLASDAAVMTDEEAVALSHIALSTFPLLPIDILEAAERYSPAEKNQVSGFIRPVEKPAADTGAPPPIIEDCASGGTAEYTSEYFIDNNDVIESWLRSKVDFIDCMASQSAGTTTQNGGALMSITLVADAQTNLATAVDMVAKFQDYSYKEATNSVNSLTLVDGEFGVSFFANPTNGTNKGFAASGTIHSASATSSVVTYDRFGLVFEESEQQDLIYIYGDVTINIENDEYSYTLSTIEPMGIANGMVQGRFLLESDGSKIFLDRINTEEIMLSADYDGDGSIDYSTNITAPLDDFITAEHFLSLPL